MVSGCDVGLRDCAGLSAPCLCAQLGVPLAARGGGPAKEAGAVDAFAKLVLEQSWLSECSEARKLEESSEVQVLQEEGVQPGDSVDSAMCKRHVERRGGMRALPPPRSTGPLASWVWPPLDSTAGHHCWPKGSQWPPVARVQFY